MDKRATATAYGDHSARQVLASSVTVNDFTLLVLWKEEAWTCIEKNAKRYQSPVPFWPAVVARASYNDLPGGRSLAWQWVWQGCDKVESGRYHIYLGQAHARISVALSC